MKIQMVIFTPLKVTWRPVFHLLQMKTHFPFFFLYLERMSWSKLKKRMKGLFLLLQVKWRMSVKKRALKLMEKGEGKREKISWREREKNVVRVMKKKKIASF